MNSEELKIIGGVLLKHGLSAVQATEIIEDIVVTIHRRSDVHKTGITGDRAVDNEGRH